MTGGSSPPWHGGRVTALATCVLAPNPGPMTLDGTNTWVLRSPGTRGAVVVDPGPDDPAHLRRVLDAVAAEGGHVEQVLLTHRHADHSAGARAFARAASALDGSRRRTGSRAGGPVGVRAMDPAHRLGEEGLAEGDVVAAAGVVLRVVATPGHTSDSVSLVLTGPDLPALLTGDTVLGRGTSVVARPDGSLGDYLASLDRLEEEVAQTGVEVLLPGHGPALGGPGDVLRGYAEHRRERVAQVRAALGAGDRTAADVVARVYAGVDRGLWPAAEQSVAATLEWLGDQPRGGVGRDGGEDGLSAPGG